MARWAKKQTTARMFLEGSTVVETDDATVMRSNRQQGEDARPILVIAHKTLSPSEIADHLRTLAQKIDEQAPELDEG